MNILISDKWLREHLDTDAKKQDIQKYVSLSGPSVEHIYEYQLSNGNKDYLYDIEVTTNRVDSMSIRGIAREAATILNRAGFRAELKDFPIKKIKKHPTVKLELPEIIYETDTVKRVLAVVLTNIQHKEASTEIKDRLAEIEVNSHEALIDITNYVTQELGHPCHAFDYDKIMKSGGKIIVKEAKKGKNFVTLDKEEHKTIGGEIVFENPKGEIIDLPAIKGTLNTGIDENTKSVLFWIESIDAKKVRFASMSHAIRTIAAQLNEKNIDPNLALDVMSYGVELMERICGAQVASDLYDYFPARQAKTKVEIPYEQIEKYLGIELKNKEIITILEDLGCEVAVKDSVFTVYPPSYRPDIAIPADVIEELARIYGYHNLPSKLMDTAIPTDKPKNLDFELEKNVKNFLADHGWQEIYSYSLVSEELALKSGFTLENHSKLSNPLKEENTYLRRSLIPSLREVITKNPQEKSFSVFELAYLYHPQANDLPKQDLSLSLLSNNNYRQVKGDFMALLEKFYVKVDQVHFKEKLKSEIKAKNVKQAAEIIYQESKKQIKLGSLSILNSQLTAIEIDFAQLLKIVRKHPSYQKIINTAKIIEQITFTLPTEIAVGEMIKDLKKLDEKIVELELSDIYQNNFTFTFVFQDKKENINSDIVEPIRKKIVKLAENDYRAKLVGQI
jgi:phenylalanyl-tRNA synthetase beta chain